MIAPPSVASSGTRSGSTVLVVDDEPSVRDFLAFVLADEGFRVETASDGDEALKLALADPPDVVLTDLMMPRVDGYQLIERLRAEGVPVRAIVAMSAVNVAHPQALRADMFIAKPFEVEQVLICLQSLVSDRARSHRPS
jgi:DNA-binding response OmpR family regulator